jgi:putative tryptophan/tyrosine transport system substrate-binding protein
MKIHTVKLGLFCVPILCIPVWVQFVSPTLENYLVLGNYSADIISIDNFYNAEDEAFQGEQLSVTTFSYNSFERINSRLSTIRNTFSVRTPDGNPIFTVHRDYGIHSTDAQHEPSFGDTPRTGYLWGPKGTAVENYVYWHVNYNEPVTLKFLATEYLYGLKVRHYTSTFLADQTVNLGHLPNVPEERGVELDVTLDVWIEPVTGYLVHYKDSATAWYYDQQTKDRIHPWNSFRNYYSRESLLQHSTVGQHLKILILFIRWSIPLLLVLLSAILLVPHKRKVVLFVSLCGSIFLVSISLYQWYAVPTTESITIGIAPWDENTDYQKNIEQFKFALDRAGLHKNVNIVYKEANAHANTEEQKRIIASFIEQDVDLIYTLTTPGTLIAKELTSEIPIVFSFVTYPKKAGIVNSLQRSGVNLVGTRNWVPVAQQLHAFLEVVPTVRTIGFVHRAGEPNSAIQFESMTAVAATLEITLLDIVAQDTAHLRQLLSEYAPQVDALYGACDTLVQTDGKIEILRAAVEHNLPTFSCISSSIEQGALMGVVTDTEEIGLLAGEKAVQILSGIPPSVLETNSGHNPMLIINSARAEDLQITIPQSLRSRALFVQ